MPFGMTTKWPTNGWWWTMQNEYVRSATIEAQPRHTTTPIQPIGTPNRRPNRQANVQSSAHGVSAKTSVYALLPSLGMVLTLALFCVGMTGCEKALFSDRQPRTQFEQYDRTHGSYVPQTFTDRNGRERAALRERLKTPNG